MPMFDLDAMRAILINPPEHLYEGTCELCLNAHRKLSDVGGVLCCDLCRQTIARQVKETGHPFTEVHVTMDPRLRGQGVPGQRIPIHNSTRHQELSNLANTLRQVYQRVLHEPIGQRIGPTSAPETS